MMEAVLIITNLPDEAAAKALAQRLIAERKAACVNILAACTSVYRWRGQTEAAQEFPLLIKTLKEHYTEVEQIIRQHHPYELPEIVAVPITAGLPAYLDWIIAETSSEKK